jgi:hypothetical protein
VPEDEGVEHGEVLQDGGEARRAGRIDGARTAEEEKERRERERERLDSRVCSPSRVSLRLNPGGPEAGPGHCTHRLRPTVRSSTTPTPSSYAFTSATAPGRLVAGRGASRPGRTTAPGRVKSPPPPPILAAHAAGRGAARPGSVMPGGQLRVFPRSGPAGLYRSAPGLGPLPGLLAGALDRRSVSPPGARRQSPRLVRLGVLPGQHCRVWINWERRHCGADGLVPLGSAPWALPGLLAGALDRRSVSSPGAWRQSQRGVQWGVLSGQGHCVWIAGNAVSARPTRALAINP